MSEIRTPRRTRVEFVSGGDNSELWQVRFWDRAVECWVDYGDPVPADQADAKMERCRHGYTP